MLKRPVFAAALFAVFAALITIYLPSAVTIPVAVLFICLAVVLIIFRRRINYFSSLPLVLLAFAVTVLYTLFILMNSLAPVVELSGSTCEVSATVIGDATYCNDYVELPVRFDNVNLPDSPENFDGLLYYSGNVIPKIGDRLSANVTFKQVSDYRQDYYYSKGMYICASLLELKSQSPCDIFSLSRLCSNIRGYVAGFFSADLSNDEAALMSGVLLSDKSEFTDSMIDAFNNSGIAHIVAVSGLHLSILTMALAKLLDRLRISKRVSALITIPFVIFVMAVVGFPYSIVRAGIMTIITLFGSLIFRKADSLTSLGIAAIAILIFDPLAVMSASFLLSFSATAGIITLSPHITKALHSYEFKNKVVAKLADYLVTTFSVSISVSVFTLPVMALYFESFQLAAPLTNLLILFAVPSLLVCGVLSVILSPIKFLAYPFLFVSGLIAKYILWISELISKLSFATVSFVPVFMKLSLCAAVLLIAICLLSNACRRTVTIAVLLSFIILSGSLLSNKIINTNRISLCVFESQRGICTAINRSNDFVLIGTGDDNTLFDAENYLLQNGGRSYGAVILPSGDDTFAAGSKRLISSDYYDIIFAENGGKYRSLLSAGDKVDCAPIESVAPFEDCVIRIIRTDGANSALVSIYDTDILICAKPLENVECDFLICTSAGVDAALPDIAIITGRADKAVLNAAEIQDKCNVYTTNDADILLNFSDSGGCNLRRLYD